MKQSSHPNIVKYNFSNKYGIYKDGKTNKRRAFIAMELCENSDLLIFVNK